MIFKKIYKDLIPIYSYLLAKFAIDFLNRYFEGAEFRSLSENHFALQNILLRLHDISFHE
tara:strand:- start:383 stop:562 length:180 start_codon:yes stop_codon:yes gene_type:complete